MFFLQIFLFSMFFSIEALFPGFTKFQLGL